MQNKFLYSFSKDGVLRFGCVCSILMVIIFVILLQLDARPTRELTEIQDQQAIIAQIPALKAKIAELKGAVNGLVLNGIISNEKRTIAVINDTFVNVGEVIDGRKLVAITNRRQVKVCNVGVGLPDKCISLFLQE